MGPLSARSYPGRGLVANIGFVKLYELAFAAELSVIGRAHSHADTMRHEPRCFVGNAKHAVQLVGRYTFFARRHKMKCERPFPIGKVARLHYRPHLHCERHAAGVALIQARPMHLSRQPSDVLRSHAAMRANRTIRPMDNLEMLPRLVFVRENRVSQIVGHRSALSMSRS
jgi:hypothetical protein